VAMKMGLDAADRLDAKLARTASPAAT
jgi:hypothetical protein